MSLLFFYIRAVSAIVQGLISFIIPKLSKKFSPQFLLIVGVSSIAIDLGTLRAITNYDMSALLIRSSLIPLGMRFGIALINTLVSLRADADR